MDQAHAVIVAAELDLYRRIADQSISAKDSKVDIVMPASVAPGETRDIRVELHDQPRFRERSLALVEGVGIAALDALGLQFVLNESLEKHAIRLAPLVQAGQSQTPFCRFQVWMGLLPRWRLWLEPRRYGRTAGRSGVGASRSLSDDMAKAP